MSNSIITRTLGSVALAIAMAGIAPAALADSLNEASNRDVVVRHVRVSYADLNLNSEVGAQGLVRRIASAATEACGGMRVGGAVALYAQTGRRFKACREIAMENAVRTVNQPTVTAAFHESETAGIRTASR